MAYLQCFASCGDGWDGLVNNNAYVGSQEIVAGNIEDGRFVEDRISVRGVMKARTCLFHHLMAVE